MRLSSQSTQNSVGNLRRGFWPIQGRHAFGHFCPGRIILQQLLHHSSQFAGRSYMLLQHLPAPAAATAAALAR